jgi:tetratricopeptide (TPR) repeat protein
VAGSAASFGSYNSSVAILVGNSSFWPAWGGYGFWNPYVYYPCPLYLPPLVVPAEAIYGPAAAWRMLDAVMPPAVPTIPTIVNAPRPAEIAPADANRKPPASDQRAVDRARRYVTLGDAAIREQNYAMAKSRYHKALAIAPDLAESYFRQGQTLVALGKYDDAVETFKRGLKLDPLWPQWPLRLDVFYGPNQVAKAAHLEAVAQRALAEPNNPDLLFLVGVELYLDGQRQRSRKFFVRAEQLTLGDAGHVRSFLQELPEHAAPLAGQPANLRRAEH